MHSLRFTGSSTDRDQVTAWATEVLADPDALILDTETTSLDGYIVEVAVTRTDGTQVLSTLVNPGVPIPREASRIHGIGDADVADAPTFAEVYADLDRVIRDRRVVIYNAAFDTRILRREVERGYVGKGHSVTNARDRAATWMRSWARWECAMEPYAAYVGDWSDYHGSYRWPPLNGGHRALSDCRAVAELLQIMVGNSGVRGGAA